MRIAHFIHRYPPALGGSEAYFARLGRHLVSRGHQVVVFSTTALDLEAFRGPGRVLPPSVTIEDGVEVRRLPLRRLPLQRWLLKAASLVPLRSWQALTLPWNPLVPGMWRTANGDEHFDVVHATAFPYGFVLASARRMARRLGVPFLLTPFIHSGDPTDPNDRTRRAFTHPALLDLARTADRVFVQTTGELEALNGLGVSRSRLILQGLGVDPKDCTGGDREKARSAWGAGPSDVVVGHLATLSAAKGSLDLLAAAETARQESTPLRLVLAGSQALEFQRGSHMRCGGFPANWAQYLGELDSTQKRDFFAGIDVFCLPSRIDSFGLVILEAWANGVPVVAYRAGGVAGVVRHEEDGLLVRCGDIAGLAAALRRLKADAELRRQLGEAGRVRIRKEFRWDDSLRIVEEALSLSVKDV